MTVVEVPEDVKIPPVDALAGLVDDEFIARLAGQARAQGLSLVGAGGVLQQLTKRVLEAALEGELDSHLGYGKHETAGRDGRNSRNGRRSKTVVTEAGPVEVDVPRDRDGSFTPQIVAKHQRRLSGVDDLVISLTAKGLTTGEVSAHLAEVYGAKVSKETISTLTDRVLDGLSDWQNRPLDRVYPVVLIDAIHVKIREGHIDDARPFIESEPKSRQARQCVSSRMQPVSDLKGPWVTPGGRTAWV
jgi:transposase-like protein